MSKSTDSSMNNAAVSSAYASDGALDRPSSGRSIVMVDWSRLNDFCGTKCCCLCFTTMYTRKTKRSYAAKGWLGGFTTKRVSAYWSSCSSAAVLAF
jgi:hypothetical protein